MDFRSEFDFRHPNGTRLHIMQGQGGIWHVFLEVSEGATQAKLREVLSLALRFRNKLLSLQGAFFAEARQLRFLMMLDKKQRSRRLSYKKLADHINTRIAERLGEFLKYERRGTESLQGLAALNAIAYLDWCGYTSPEADEILQEAYEDLQRGRKPFPPEYPVTRTKVREMLRSFRQTKVAKRLESVPAALEDVELEGELRRYCDEEFARLWGREPHNILKQALIRIRPAVPAK
jgi:hypothetical protein